MNEIKEKKEINEALLWNMMGGNPHGQPTHSTNISKEGYHRKWANIPKEEEKEEHTPKLPQRHYHSLSSDNSFSPCRKIKKNNDNLQVEFQNIKYPTYEGEMNTGEK